MTSAKLALVLGVATLGATAVAAPALAHAGSPARTVASSGTAGGAGGPVLDLTPPPGLAIGTSAEFGVAIEGGRPPSSGSLRTDLTLTGLRGLSPAQVSLQYLAAGRWVPVRWLDGAPSGSLRGAAVPEAAAQGRPGLATSYRLTLSAAVSPGSLQLDAVLQDSGTSTAVQVGEASAEVLVEPAPAHRD